jgi:hypothetical protein
VAAQSSALRIKARARRKPGFTDPSTKPVQNAEIAAMFDQAA